MIKTNQANSLRFTRRMMAWAFVALSTFGLTGCGTSVTLRQPPVEVVLKVSKAGQPVDNVSLTLQPLGDGAQAESSVSKGEWKGTVVPGKYTFYIDKGKTEADLNKVPANYRLGSKDRTLDIKDAGTYEVQLN